MKALRALKPTQSVRTAVREKLDWLPTEYAAIHIRNTDLRADMETLEETLHLCEGLPILICSAHLELPAKIAEDFTGFPILHFGQDCTCEKSTDSQHPLHKDRPDLPRAAVNTQMIVELIAMARAKVFHPLRLHTNTIKGISGFSDLIKHLRAEQIVLEQF